MLSPVGPIGLDASKTKRFAVVVLKKFALSLAGAVGAKLGEKLIDSLFANDDEDEDDTEDGEP